MLSLKEISLIANKMARQIIAASHNAKKSDLAGMMREEKYQRTMTDEYPFSKKPRAGFEPVPEEQKAIWQKLNEKRG